MKFAYKVWHSEPDKWEIKRRAGRALSDVEIADMHERLPEMLLLSYGAEPGFTARVIVLQPSLRGAILVLETAAGTEDGADQSIARCLGRINGLDPDVCLVAEPLAKSKEAARPDMQSALDMLRTRGASRALTRSLSAGQAEHIYISLFDDGPQEECGLTFERPFRLHATASNIGVPQEYAKLGQLYGEIGRDWSVHLRSRESDQHGRMIETFKLELADKTRVAFHFDVTSFYRN